MTAPLTALEVTARDADPLIPLMAALHPDFRTRHYCALRWIDLLCTPSVED